MRLISQTLQFAKRVLNSARMVILGPAVPSALTKTDIRKLVNRPDPVVFEIGCADGLDTLEFLETFHDPGLRMYCFEPDPRNVESFKQRIHDPRVQLFQMAVGDRDDKMIFHQSSTIYSSSLKEPNVETLNAKWPTIKFDREFEVDVVTLDTFLAQHDINRIDFVWADVQGAEDMLLHGAKKSLRDKIRFFYTEYSDVAYYKDEPDLRAILQNIGPNWKVIRDYKTDVLLKNAHL